MPRPADPRTGFEGSSRNELRLVWPSNIAAVFHDRSAEITPIATKKNVAIGVNPPIETGSFQRARKNFAKSVDFVKRVAGLGDRDGSSVAIQL